VVDTPIELNAPSHEDSIVCYCYRLTTGDLKRSYKACGSLKGVEAATRAGTGCKGCKVILHSLFGETPTESADQQYTNPLIGTACAKPGNRIMKGLVIADGELESTIYSSNAVAPQLGECDSSTPIEYALVDHRGKPVLVRQGFLKTNETFVFDTRQEDIPRPFYGMFFLSINRSNFGASRFNIYWSNGKSITATHENADTGRPICFLPFFIDQRFIDRSNEVYVAILNPHTDPIAFRLTIEDVDGNSEPLEWHATMDRYSTTWLPMNTLFFDLALKHNPLGRFSCKIHALGPHAGKAMTVYFFMRNKATNIWTVNHL
jgi:hypothetical protein